MQKCKGSDVKRSFNTKSCLNEEQAQMSEYDEDDVLIDDYSCFDNVTSTKECSSGNQSDETQSNSEKLQNIDSEAATKSEENPTKGNKN